MQMHLLFTIHMHETTQQGQTDFAQFVAKLKEHGTHVGRDLSRFSLSSSVTRLARLWEEGSKV